jgi:RNA polymerase sigma-70 factor (ECF subfamily)
MENKEKIRNLLHKWNKNRTEENYEKFYNSVEPIINRIVFCYLKNSEDSNEITQEIFINIYNLDSLKIPRVNEISWLYEMTKNISISLIKSRFPNVTIDDVFKLVDERNEIEKIISNDKYQSLIYNLPFKEQEIITLKEIGEFSFEEISNLLDMKIKMVKWYYYKSIKTLRLAVGNFAMFIITGLLFIKSHKKEHTNELSSEENNNYQNINSFENKTNDMSNTKIENNLTNTISTTESSTSEDINTPYFFEDTSLSFGIASIVFLIATIVFGILFLNFQKKKSDTK